MAMIKNALASELARDAVVLDLGDLKRQAEDLRRRAENEAERIIAEAQEQRRRLLEGAAEEGRAEGREQGIAEGRAEGAEEGRAAALKEHSARIDNVLTSWAAALTEFERSREDILLEARADVLRLALKVAEKVTKRAVACDPSVIESQLKAALSQLLAPTRLLVSVHPDDYEAAEDILPDMVDRLASGAHTTLRSDESITRGGCIVRTDRGEIDATIETQLGRIVERLLPSSDSVSDEDERGGGVDDSADAQAEEGDA